MGQAGYLPAPVSLTVCGLVGSIPGPA